MNASEPATQFDRPLFVIGAPRSGTTILFRCLALHKNLWHLAAESHAVLEGPFHPAKHGFESNRITVDDVTEATAEQIRDGFFTQVINPSAVNDRADKMFRGNSLQRRLWNRARLAMAGSKSREQLKGPVRLVEKTPKNALRISGLTKIFPSAHFLHLKRDVEHNLDSLIAGWHATQGIGPFRRPRFARSGYSIAKNLLTDYPGDRWKFVLPPRWRELRGRSIADAAMLQLQSCQTLAAADLKSVDSARQREISFDDFVADPVEHLKSIFAWLDLPMGHDARPAISFAEQLPVVNHTGRTHDAMRYPHDVERVLFENRWTEFPGERTAADALPVGSPIESNPGVVRCGGGMPPLRRVQ